MLSRRMSLMCHCQPDFSSVFTTQIVPPQRSLITFGIGLGVEVVSEIDFAVHFCPIVRANSGSDRHDSGTKKFAAPRAGPGGAEGFFFEDVEGPALNIVQAEGFPLNDVEGVGEHEPGPHHVSLRSMPTRCRDGCGPKRFSSSL